MTPTDIRMIEMTGRQHLKSACNHIRCGSDRTLVKEYIAYTVGLADAIYLVDGGPRPKLWGSIHRIERVLREQS